MNILIGALEFYMRTGRPLTALRVEPLCQDFDRELECRLGENRLGVQHTPRSVRLQTVPRAMSTSVIESLSIRVGKVARRIRLATP